MVDKDQLDYLVRRFRQIAPQPLTGWDRVRCRELGCWLRDDVSPVMESFLMRPRFQAQAAWPLQTLRQGAGTTERALVDKVDMALVEHGGALLQLARKTSIKKRLETVAVENLVSEEEVLLGPGHPQVVRRGRSKVDQLAVFLAHLEQIANRSWQDLVCLDDYFEPMGAWMTGKKLVRQTGEPALAVPGEFVVALNPELHPGGDFVSRCLCWRVEGLLRTLQDFLHFGAEAFRKDGVGLPKQWAEANQRNKGLTDLVNQLRHACLAGDQQPLRDTCILLTQVEVVLCPEADLSWLGLPDVAVRIGAHSMRHRLRSCHRELLERLAASLSCLKTLYADADQQLSAIEEAIARGGLVVVRDSQQVYWEGKPLDVKWNRYPKRWDFLVAVAEKGRRGSVVEDRDLYDYAPARSTLATMLTRLRQLVPASLWKHIEPSTDPKGYRLDLDRQHIHLF
jgi:hypothetical protein